MRFVPKAEIDVGDMVIFLLRFQRSKPIFISVVSSAQRGIGTHIPDLLAGWIQEPDIHKRFARLTQMLQVAAHFPGRRRKPYLAGVEQLKQVYQSLLEKEVEGNPLAFGQGPQKRLSALFHRYVELEVEIGGQDGQRKEKGENEADLEPAPEIPKVDPMRVLPRRHFCG